MDIATLQRLSNENPAWGLLRKTSAPAVLAFLYDAYKTRARTEIPSEQLAVELSAFQDLLTAEGIDSLKGSPETILSAWASDQECILWRSHDADTDQYVFTLRATTEDVLQFVADLQETRRPVAAESSLKRIFSLLEEVVLIGHGDVDIHIQRLREKQAGLQREIDRLSEDGLVQRNAYRIREEFRLLLSEIQSLSGDFRGVEEAFREIAKDIQNARIHSGTNRGDLLEYLLDSDEQIRSSDQGKSFYGFLALLNSPDQLDQLDDLRRQLSDIPELAEFDLSEIMRFERRLLAEAGRVNKTVQRLSRQLRRALDDKANAERQHILARIQIILERLQNDKLDPQLIEKQVGLEEVAPIRLLGDYTPYRPPAKLQRHTANIFTADSQEENAAFDTFAQMQRLDLPAMTRSIERTFDRCEQDQVELLDVLEDRPLKHGSVEIAAYLQIAHDRRCPIDHQRTQRIRFTACDGIPAEFIVPSVTFLRHAFSPSSSSHS